MTKAEQQSMTEKTYRLYHGDSEVASLTGNEGMTDRQVIQQALKNFDNLSDDEIAKMGLNDDVAFINHRAKIRWSEVRR